MTGFADKHCEPCEGGVAPLSAEEAATALKELHADWHLSQDGRTLFRDFEFPVYSRTIAFANAVAWIATSEGHHPEMTVRYGSLSVSYRTTAIDGLSDNDFICAAKIDRLIS